MAIIFIISSVAVSVFMGGAIDLARSYRARLKLNSVASMTCQYASKPSVLSALSGVSGQTTYVNSVGSYITNALSDQGVTYSQTVAAPFSFSANGPATVNLSVAVPTAFMSIVGVSQVNVSASSYCFDSSNTVINNGNPVEESFEFSHVSCASWCSLNPTGALNNPPSNPVGTFPASPGYTGSSGSRSSWYIMGYCLEIDAAGTVAPNAPEGSKSIELDCESGGSTRRGNSSITTKVALTTGDYELRYFYNARVGYGNYTPAYLCGSTASDLAWATDGNSDAGTGVARTNQINVYLDRATLASPPTHLTIGGTTLAGSNLIDMCVYSNGWIERSVKITVTTSGNYWLTFAADGADDTLGGLIDHIRLCINACNGSVQDNFPWAANTELHRDTFESPVFFSSGINSPFASTGTSGTSSSGWPDQAAAGWAAAPKNQVSFQLNICPQGRQCVGSANGENSLWSRPFLLVPGYYKLIYNYTTEVILSGMSGALCGATPSAAGYTSLTGSSVIGVKRATFEVVGNQSKDTNTIGVFMSHPGLISQLNASSSSGSDSTYTNPNGTVSSSPTNSPVAISLSSYNAAQNNPLLDMCIHTLNAVSRTAHIKIQKPAWYWLTFASLGAGGSYTGFIDDVRLTATASLYTASPPANAVTIPVPSPAPGSTISFTGFSIVADRLTP